MRAHALAAQLLDRHGVLTRAVAPAEGIGGRFGDVYRVLAALEQGGQVRRGYFVERLGGSQFALPGAVDRLRVDAQVVDQAADEQGAHDPRVRRCSPPPTPPTPTAPPSPGRARPTETPPRAPGTARAARPAPLVVLVDGALVLYLERGGRTVLSFTDDAPVLAAAADALASTVRTRRAGRLTIDRIDGVEVLVGGRCTAPLGRALVAAGFATTPRGLRLRDAP